MHGEKVGLVAKLGDQREFVLNQRAHVGRHDIARGRGRGGRAVGRWRRAAPASCRPLLDELTQPLGGSAARGHEFTRIFVAQLIERKAAARSNSQRLGE